MITRGYVLVSHPLDRVHDAVLETCKEMNAEVKDIKRNSEIEYQIEVQTASILDKAFRVGPRFQIRLQNKQTKPKPNTLIDIYDYHFHPESETKFIFPFFRCLAKYLDSGFRIYPVETHTDSQFPTYALAERNHRLFVLPTLLEAFHYSISIINDGGISAVKSANVLGINFKNGSTVLLMRGRKKVLFTIPIREIVEVAATSYRTGRIRKDKICSLHRRGGAIYCNQDFGEFTLLLMVIHRKMEYHAKLMFFLF